MVVLQAEGPAFCAGHDLSQVGKEYVNPNDLDKNGKLLLMLDPPAKPDSAPLPNLVALAHEWGVDATNSIVVDASGMGRLIGADASVPIAANYPAHPITNRFTVMTAYPLARGLQVVQGGVGGHNASPVVESSPQSWAEADIKSLLTSGEVSLDEGKGDKPGPVTIAAAVAAPAPDAEKAAEPKPGGKRPVKGARSAPPQAAANAGTSVRTMVEERFTACSGWVLTVRP